jgi:hypothetical protein
MPYSGMVMRDFMPLCPTHLFKLMLDSVFAIENSTCIREHLSCMCAVNIHEKPG